MAPISPARLSSLSTSTLTQLLELHRTRTLNLPSAPSLIPTISRNLSSLRAGLDALEEEQRRLEMDPGVGEEEVKSSEEVLIALEGQWERLKGLAEKEGIEVVQGGRKGKDTVLLIDDGMEDGLNMGSLHRSPTTAQAPSLPSKQEARIDFSDPNELDMMDRDENDLRQANQDVMMMQKQMLNDQDRSLDALSEAVSRQRDISLQISSELELHTGLLEETDFALDQTQSRMRKAQSRLDTVARKTKENAATCTIIGLIVVLLILIIVLK
ncbi:hypothetical protein BT69DRAFT_1289184 [Atractiella rhizophila]|nr:hypothetical protein BT69DRAFT_1289184 [Atractiella rhizophila]